MLDMRFGAIELRLVKSCVMFALLFCIAIPTFAQAPQAADMWRVATAALGTPAALQSGATGAFWNPAPQSTTRPRPILVGVQVLQTSDALGLSGILAGGNHAIGEMAVVGISVARVEVRDLVRTSDSPFTELGSIPVYEQLVGVQLGFRLGALSAGGVIRGHEARFDAVRSTGATFDAGLRFAASSRVTVAAATHFLPLTFRSDNTTDYYGAVEYQAVDLVLWGHDATIVSRYGASYRSPGGVEHSLGAGMVIDRLLAVDVAGTREVAFGDSAWRAAFQIGLALGRYSLVAARGSGFNGLGALYRFALEVALS